MGPDTPAGADLCRVRDGIYADDLVLVAVAWLDVFTFLSEHPVDIDGLCLGLGFAPRPADVMCTLFRAMGLLEQEPNPLRPTPLAIEHLAAGGRFDLPGDHDLHLLSHVLHDWDEDGVRQILTASFNALPSGGWLVDHDAHINFDKTGPLAIALFRAAHSAWGKRWQCGRGTDFSSMRASWRSHREAGPDRSVMLARKP